MFIFVNIFFIAVQKKTSAKPPAISSNQQEWPSDLSHPYQDLQFHGNKQLAVQKFDIHEQVVSIGRDFELIQVGVDCNDVRMFAGELGQSGLGDVNGID